MQSQSRWLMIRAIGLRGLDLCGWFVLFFCVSFFGFAVTFYALIFLNWTKAPTKIEQSSNGYARATQALLVLSRYEQTKTQNTFQFAFFLFVVTLFCVSLTLLFSKSRSKHTSKQWWNTWWRWCCLVKHKTRFG